MAYTGLTKGCLYKEEYYSAEEYSAILEQLLYMCEGLKRFFLRKARQRMHRIKESISCLKRKAKKSQQNHFTIHRRAKKLWRAHFTAGHPTINLSFAFQCSMLSSAVMRLVNNLRKRRIMMFLQVKDMDDLISYIKRCFFNSDTTDYIIIHQNRPSAYNRLDCPWYVVPRDVEAVQPEDMQFRIAGKMISNKEVSTVTSGLTQNNSYISLYKDTPVAQTLLQSPQNVSGICASKPTEEYSAIATYKIVSGWTQGTLELRNAPPPRVYIKEKESISHLNRPHKWAKKFCRRDRFTTHERSKKFWGDHFTVRKQAKKFWGDHFTVRKQAKKFWGDHFADGWPTELKLHFNFQCSLKYSRVMRLVKSIRKRRIMKSLQGKYMDALISYFKRCFFARDTTAYIIIHQNRPNAYKGLDSLWYAVPTDVEAVQAEDMQLLVPPIQECTQSHLTENKRHTLVAPEGSYIKLPLDDEEDILSKDSLPLASDTVNGTNSVDLKLMVSFDIRTPNCLKARQERPCLQKMISSCDLEHLINLSEEKFNAIKGGDTYALSQSLLELNTTALYPLQIALTLLGDQQGALQVAEHNRGRNLEEILWKKKWDYGRQQHGDLPSPLGLKNIWNFINRERVPVVVLSYIQQSSTMLVHMVFPNEEQSLWRGLPGVFPSGQSDILTPSSYLFEMSFSRNAADILSTHQSEKSEPFRIPSNNYCFMKIDLPKEYFIAKRYGSLVRLVDEEPIPFEQYVQKTLIDYLNQKDAEIFTPIKFQDDESPLTILYERLARGFIEEIEQRWPKGREFVVIADQTAHFLPWPLLQDESTKVFLGDRYRVRTYPSLLTMGLMNHQGVEVIHLPLVSQDRFLIIGNPTISKFEHNGKEITLGRLPHAETEAVQVAHILEVNPLLREMATKPTVEYRLQTAQIIHVATHASAVGGYLAFASSIPIVNTARPIDSKDALLFIDDIQKLRINASLVVLSACDSARGQLVNKGVNSIARAFLAAGAQSVLASLVRVPDQSASIFMSLFYRFLTHNEFTTSEAIQKSSMVIRCIKSLSQHIHWGGYRLVGRDIRMKYNEECEAAKVAKLVGETSAFPRVKELQKLDNAIFRQDCQSCQIVVSVL